MIRRICFWLIASFINSYIEDRRTIIDSFTYIDHDSIYWLASRSSDDSSTTSIVSKHFFVRIIISSDTWRDMFDIRIHRILISNIKIREIISIIVSSVFAIVHRFLVESFVRTCLSSCWCDCLTHSRFGFWREASTSKSDRDLDSYAEDGRQ